MYSRAEEGGGGLVSAFSSRLSVQGTPRLTLPEASNDKEMARSGSSSITTGHDDEFMAGWQPTVRKH